MVELRRPGFQLYFVVARLRSPGPGGWGYPNDDQFAAALLADAASDFYTHLGHLRGQVHGVNYKLAAPLAAIGLRRLALLDSQLNTRRVHAQRILDALPRDGLLRELGHGPNDRPNYYNLVLTATSEQARVADALSGLGLPPDSVRYGYRALCRQPIFAEYASRCPNAEALATSTFQIPVHPGLPEATV